MGHSVLQVPVPALEQFVRSRTAHYDTDYLSRDPAFVHAHITVLGPFLDVIDDRVAATVAAIAAKVEPFAIVLERVETFPNGIIHLVPEPDEPCRELTRLLWAAYPQCPPYRGEFADVRPPRAPVLAARRQLTARCARIRAWSPSRITPRPSAKSASDVALTPSPCQAWSSATWP